MAELPRYRPLGVSIGSMPSVNFVQTGAAEAQVYDNISKGLNAISDFVYERAVAEAEIAAVEYGAGLAPSVKQLEDASRSGVTLDPDLPDGFTIFDQKARKTAIDVMQTNMEIAARNEISALSIEAKNTDMSADEFQLKLDGIIDGYSSALGQVNPVAAVNLQAAITPVANSKLTTHANDMAAKAEAQEKVAVSYTVDGIINNIPDIIAAGNKISQRRDQDPTITTVDDILEAERNRIAVLAYGIESQEFLNAKLTEFDKNVLEAKSDYINDWVRGSGEDDVTALDRLGQVLDNKIIDENIRGLISGLSLEEKNKIIADGFNVLAEEEKIAEVQDKREEENRKEIINDIKVEIAEAIIAGDQEARMTAINKLKLVDDEEYASQLEAIGVGGAYDDPDTIDALNSLTASSLLTEDHIKDALRDGVLTTETSKTYYTSLKSQRDAKNNKAMSIIRNHFGVPEASILSPSGVAVPPEHRQAVVAAELELQEAVDINPDFDRMAWAKQYIKDVDEGLPRSENQDTRLSIIRQNKLNSMIDDPNLKIEDTQEIAALLTKKLDDNIIDGDEYIELLDFIMRKKPK